MKNWRNSIKGIGFYSRELLKKILRALKPNALRLGSVEGSLQAIQLAMITNAGFPTEVTTALIQQRLGWNLESVEEFLFGLDQLL
jgi:hypothetical protein